MIVIRVLVLATLCSPVLVAQETPQLLFPTYGNEAAGLPELPAPEMLPPVTATAPMPAPVVDTSLIPAEPHPPIANYVPQGMPANSYFMVSSRCSVQNIRSWDRWGLDVFQRFGDAPLQRSNMRSMTSQFVPGMPVCIYVHGSFVKWESQCKEAHEAFNVFQTICPNQPMQMIFYTWPSDGPYTYIAPIDVTVRGEQAEFNGFHLAWLISQIPESCPVCLIGHSHGTRAILSALHMAGGGTILGHQFTGNMGNRRYRAVLAAAAMDHHWLNPGQRYECALGRVDCVLHLRNRADLPLAAYPLTRPFARRSLGRAGITWFDQRQLGYNAGKINELDVTTIVGHQHYWPNYYSDPSIAAAMKSYVVFAP